VDQTTVDEHPPSWNVAPTQQVLTVASSKDGSVRMLGEMRWGLVPSWAKDPSIGSRMINARAETVGKSNAYRRAFASRRLALPADGYFEWQRRPPAEGEKKARKQPYWIHPAAGGTLALGGLWEVWHDAEGQRLTTCTIITVAANERSAEVHDRMPLILPPAASFNTLPRVETGVTSWLAVCPTLSMSFNTLPRVETGVTAAREAAIAEAGLRSIPYHGSRPVSPRVRVPLPSVYLLHFQYPTTGRDRCHSLRRRASSRAPPTFNTLPRVETGVT